MRKMLKGITVDNYGSKVILSKRIKQDSFYGSYSEKDFLVVVRSVNKQDISISKHWNMLTPVIGKIWIDRGKLRECLGIKKLTKKKKEKVHGWLCKWYQGKMVDSNKGKEQKVLLFKKRGSYVSNM